jgi:histidinol-phosphate/aromatic aminotransferase/cobyric acid decarboxylase-like protein
LCFYAFIIGSEQLGHAKYTISNGDLNLTIHMSLSFLQPEKCWEADLEEMASRIDERTKLIVVINPSNPCGSVYTKEQLEAILDGEY